VDELQDLKMSDDRLKNRILKICSSFLNNPNQTIPKACGSWKDTKAAYRLFDNPKVVAAEILHEHRSRTFKRAHEYTEVLAIEDTSYIQYPGHRNSKKSLSDLHGRTDYKIPGFLLHTTLLTTISGTPLGVVDQQVIERIVGQGDPELRKIDNRESIRWLDSLESIFSCRPSGLKVTIVADREADFYRKLSWADQLGFDYVIRSRHDRRMAVTNKGSLIDKNTKVYLSDILAQTKISLKQSIEIFDKKTGKNRIANFSIRWTKISFPEKTNHLRNKKSGRHMLLECYVVDCSESKKNGLNWRLLTNSSIENSVDALRVIDIYRRRWLIEEFFKTLKSGCLIEDLRFETIERLERCLAIYSIVSWKILMLTKIGRESPDISSEVVFNESEWKILQLSVNKSVTSSAPRIADAIGMLGQLGGHLGRKHDGPPGIKTIWRGWQELRIRHDMYLKLNCG